MTCIVGIATPGKGSLLAYDSLAGGNGTYAIRKDPKGAKLTPWLALGFTTSYRFGQILCNYLDPGDVAPEDAYTWTMKQLVPQMRTLLSEHGWLKTESNREEAGEVILAIRDRIIVVHSDFQVGETAAGYAACGSGEDIALGALYALRSTTPKNAARVALEAAESVSVYVRRPWHFHEVRA